jgi:HEAT repeat protein
MIDAAAVAVCKLLETSPQMLSVVVAHLRKPTTTWAERVAIARALGWQKAPQPTTDARFTVLRVLVQDHDEAVRFDAASALAKLEHQEALPTLRVAENAERDALVREHMRELLEDAASV